MILTRLLLIMGITACLTVACGEQPGPIKPAIETPRTLPVPSWICEPGRPDASVVVDGESIVVRRGTHGAEQYLSRAYLDLDVQAGAQYVFRYTAQIEGHGNGRVFCYIGNDAGVWDEINLIWSPTLPPGLASDGILPLVVPADGARIRLCVAAEGAEVAARFTSLSLQAVIPPLILSPAAGAVLLDGRLDDALWSDATTLTPMRVLGDISRFATLPTETRVAVRDGWLWIGVRCPEPDPARMRLTPKDVFEIFADDCIEVYVSKDQVEYSQIVANALGKCAWRRMGNGRRSTTSQRAPPPGSRLPRWRND